MLAVASVKATNVVIELPPPTETTTEETMKIRTRTLLLFGTAAIALAACGSSPSSGPSASPDPLQRVDHRVRRVVTDLRVQHGREGSRGRSSRASRLSTPTAARRRWSPRSSTARPPTSSRPRTPPRCSSSSPRDSSTPRRRFCKNKLEIIVAPGNPKNIKTLADLANSRSRGRARRSRASRWATMRPRR